MPPAPKRAAMVLTAISMMAVSLVGPLAGPAAAVGPYTSTDVPKTIPDGSGVPAISTITVADAGPIVDIDIRVRIQHTFPGDLVLTLQSPAGTEVVLSAENGIEGTLPNYGGGTANCSGTFTVFDDNAAAGIVDGNPPFLGQYQPEEALSTLNGESVTGPWKLKVSDEIAEDGGSISCWKMDVIVAGTPIPPIPSTGGGVAIPDNGTGATKTISVASPPVPFGFKVLEASPEIRIDHPRPTDLVVSLRSPDNTEVVLFNRLAGTTGPGFGSGDCTTGQFTRFADTAATTFGGASPYAGSYRPHAALSAMLNRGAVGDWKLVVKDMATGETGTLQCWRLNLTVYDANKPTVSMSSLSPSFQKKSGFTLSWSGADAENALDLLEAEQRSAAYNKNLGAFSVWQSVAGQPSVTQGFTGKAGYTYCFRARAVDESLNASAYAGPTCTAIPLGSASLSHAGKWAKKRTAGYYTNRYSSSRTKGASISRSGIKAKRIAIVATKGPGMGTVNVYLGKTLLKTVKLSAAKLRKKQVIEVKRYGSVKSGTVKIVVTSRRKEVRIEGLGLSKT